MQRFTLEGQDVVLLGTVQGLVAEAARVRGAFEETRPAAVAVGVSPEALAAVSRYQPDGGNPFDDLPDAEYAYSQRLASFGEVALPPPDLVEAVRLAGARGVPAYGVDLTEEQYEETFTREIGPLALLRYGRIQRRLAKRPPEAEDARAFSLAWDAELRRLEPLARVERRREDRMAEGARAVARQAGGAVLLIVDAPREAGVAERLAAAARPPDG